MSKTNDTSPKGVTVAGKDAAVQDEESVVDAVLSMPTRLGKSTLATARPESTAVTRTDGIVIGKLVRITGDGRAEVSYPGNPVQGTLLASSTVKMTQQDIGNEVALAFLGGDPEQPIVLGLVQYPAQDQPGVTEEHDKNTIDVKVDGERVTLSADKEIVLKCGKASITLTRAGKIIVKGAYVSTHSTGVNRIKGGSVQLN